MQIYLYDPSTGEIIGEREAKTSPLDKSPLIPAFATKVAPPEQGAGFARCFIDGGWVYVEDHRGETVYNTTTGELKVITDLGKVGTDFTATPYPGNGYKWNRESWELDRAAWLDSDIRPRRNQLLDEADLRHCNAERWDSMTITLREAWVAYKQVLRDLPDTIDHDNPVWPVMPG